MCVCTQDGGCLKFIQRPTKNALLCSYAYKHASNTIKVIVGLS